MRRVGCLATAVHLRWVCVAGRLGVEGELAYYTVANAAHYPGAVALLNSLRLLGEEAPVFVVDCGLTGPQRDELSRHVTLVPRRGELPPGLQKATGPLAHPAKIMVLLDADVIVTRPSDSAVRGCFPRSSRDVRE